MKKILLCLIFLFSAKAFSQTDSLYKTDNVFLISFKDFNNEVQNLEDVRLTSIDSISLSYEYIIWGKSSNENKNVKKQLVFDRIQKFGYKVGPSKGAIIGRSALVGFGLGFILGAIEGKINIVGDGSRKPEFADHIGTGFLVGVLLAIPATLAGVIISIPVKEYETLDISKYNRQKKFEILKRLIRNGVKENE
jgi:hypothetical protein